MHTVQLILETVRLHPAAPLHDRDRDLLDRARRHTSRSVETIDAVLKVARHRDGDYAM